jgi:hypothetical protein
MRIVFKFFFGEGEIIVIKLNFYDNSLGQIAKDDLQKISPVPIACTVVSVYKDR